MTQDNAWYRKKRQKLIKEFGSSCWLCPKDSLLDFAHIKPTNLSGSGRGFNHRVVDVQRHKDCYALLCKECHKRFDKEEGWDKEVSLSLIFVKQTRLGIR